MKKVIVLLLSMSILICGCSKSKGKSDEVIEVENKISRIDQISLDSYEIIEQAQNAYEQLSDGEKDDVENYDVLADAVSSYDSLVDDTIDSIEVLYNKIEDAVDDDDMISAYNHLEELESYYEALPAEKQDLVDLGVSISSIRSDLDDMCYPGTPICRFDLIVGSIGITSIDDDDVAPKFVSQYYYEYTDGDLALNAFNDYVSFLGRTPGITYVTADPELYTITYSYGGDKLFDIFILYFGEYGGYVSIGFER